MRDHPHLGTGWQFPVRWHRDADGAGHVATADGEQAVAQSIRLIVRTALGERVMRPEFGSTAEDQVFGTREAASCHRLAHELRTALLRFEPRAIVDRVEAVAAGDDQDNRVDVTVEFRIDPHRRPTSLVLPFYLEGNA
ncbi:baseplate protein [Streptomyces sp. HUCO-GS316]|uniref:GPW/gp25 family protein n=1 Tax=Streptomyces sp. HUCO-GS316 TaxID=2692198 RepID=UPI00136B5A92|nr:GPW/gp25 family protein [Streptomyces sp. HUCO-GS316]MXM66539.1 baseplate protein [Streptomyces sp. HUCO-GS316]